MPKYALFRSAALLGMAAAAVSGGNAALAAPAAEITKILRNGMLSVTPESSFVRPGDAGIRAHTNFSIVLRDSVHRSGSTPVVGLETPASLACVYGFAASSPGCNPTTATALATGGSKVVIIVDAFDDPTAQNDLSVFSTQYGLPAITADNFAVQYASGTKPPQDSTGGWEFEESLDIEMAHAMAPGAKVILMEADSNSNKDLYAAVKVAAKVAEAAGGGEVSMSWEGGETANEEKNEKVFTGTNVVFLASTGDAPGTGSPSTMQNVIGVGGTNIVRNGAHDFENQVTWPNTGGGLSEYVSIPTYQAAIKQVVQIVGTKRGVPDISMNGGPSTAVSLYDTTPYNGAVLKWTGAYGTSESCPLLAGALNAAGGFAKSTSAELTTAYKGYKKVANWTDIVAGTCGNNGGSKAKKGYDLCSGIGVPAGYGGK